MSKYKPEQEQMSQQQSYDNESSQEQNRSFQSEDNQSESEQESQEIRKKKEQLLELEEKRIKAELKQIPYGELLRYKNLKDQVGTESKKQVKKDRSKKQLPSTEKREKNAPKQIKIMKRPVKSKPKVIFESQKSKSIDPRFQSYAGSFNSDLATKSYSFIRDVQQNQVSHLKKQLKNKKIKESDKEILLKNYNRVTNDIKRFEHSQLEQKVKSQLRGKNFTPKRREFKQHVQRAKLGRLDSKSQDKRIKKKEKKIQKQRGIQKRQFMSKM